MRPEVLPPLALGHAIAIAGALIVAASLEIVVPLSTLRWIVGLMLAAFGVSRLVFGRHPRYGGMLVNARELTVWSALMAAAHDAGLMVVPFVITGTAPDLAEGPHAGHLAVVASGPAVEAAVMTTVIHTIGYLAATCLLTFLVYEYLGVSVIKRGG